MEQVVLVDECGQPIGVADKATVHAATTPRHLAFSCYGFNAAGQLLVTRRSRHKITFPGVWTNTCCGHPGPWENIEDAIARRLEFELGMAATSLHLVLPEFSYRASQDGIEENELCPVYIAHLEGVARPNPGEVEQAQWWEWDEFRQAATDPDSGISPWARMQMPLLEQAYFGVALAT